MAIADTATTDPGTGAREDRTETTADSTCVDAPKAAAEEDENAATTKEDRESVLGLLVDDHFGTRIRKSFGSRAFWGTIVGTYWIGRGLFYKVSFDDGDVDIFSAEELQVDLREAEKFHGEDKAPTTRNCPTQLGTPYQGLVRDKKATLKRQRDTTIFSTVDEKPRGPFQVKLWSTRLYATILEDNGVVHISEFVQPADGGKGELESTGKVRVGDVLLAVDGRAVKGMDHVQASNLIRSASRPLTLTFIGESAGNNRNRIDSSAIKDTQSDVTTAATSAHAGVAVKPLESHPPGCPPTPDVEIVGTRSASTRDHDYGHGFHDSGANLTSTAQTMRDIREKRLSRQNSSTMGSRGVFVAAGDVATNSATSQSALRRPSDEPEDRMEERAQQGATRYQHPGNRVAPPSKHGNGSTPASMHSSAQRCVSQQTHRSSDVTPHSTLSVSYPMASEVASQPVPPYHHVPASHPFVSAPVGRSNSNPVSRYNRVSLAPNPLHSQHPGRINSGHTQADSSCRTVFFSHADIPSTEPSLYNQAKRIKLSQHSAIDTHITSQDPRAANKVLHAPPPPSGSFLSVQAPLRRQPEWSRPSHNTFVPRRRSDGQPPVYGEQVQQNVDMMTTRQLMSARSDSPPTSSTLRLPETDSTQTSFLSMNQLNFLARLPAMKPAPRTTHSGQQTEKNRPWFLEKYVDGDLIEVTVTQPRLYLSLATLGQHVSVSSFVRDGHGGLGEIEASGRVLTGDILVGVGTFEIHPYMSPSDVAKVVQELSRPFSAYFLRSSWEMLDAPTAG